VVWRGRRWWGPGWGWPVADGFASQCGWYWTPAGYQVWQCWPRYGWPGYVEY
jgi:hypothetical protein